MAENPNEKPNKVHLPHNPEDLRTKYDALLAYINTVVTFRFTTLSLYLAAVALILGAKPSLGIYLLLSVITISVYLIELRNRYIKNDLEALAKQIEHKWGYTANRKDDYKPESVTIFNIVVPITAFKAEDEDEDEEEANKRSSTTTFGKTILKPLITHSIALDILYISVLLYALIHVIALLIQFVFFFTF